MASAVSSYASSLIDKMHPESDTSSVASSDAFSYEPYSQYTTPAGGANTKKPGDKADRSLTISTNAPMGISPNKTAKKNAPTSPSKKDMASKDAANAAAAGPRAEHLKPRLCTVPGCKKRVRSKGLCKAHGGGRRCMVEGCERSSQGQGLCIRHGGGKRCTQPGCTKASQSNGLCKAHGGGLRCQAPNCTKSSQGGGFCRAHGGGQRCEKEGCNKGAQRGGFCAGHGGSRFCQHPDCTKNDRGGGYCAEHGGGKRCDQQGCNKPARKKGKCSYHANANKAKAPKDAAAAAPPPMMDMRQITAPGAAYGGMPGMPQVPKDVTGMRDTMDQHPAIRSYPPVSSYQQRVEMDQRYSKGYDQPLPMGAAPSASNQYLPMHADQRYDPMAMQQQASRHYMDSSLPSVSSGYSAQHKHQSMTASMAAAAGIDRSASPYNPAGRPHPHAYSQQQQHWSSKDGMPTNGMQERASMDYFDMKDQAAAAAAHHQAYGNASQQYHHHMSVADSAAAAAAYGNQRESYYHHAASAGSEQPGNSSMMYNSYSYQPHQMHNMNLL